MRHKKITADIGLSTYESVDCTLAEFKAGLDTAAAFIGADAANVFIEYERDYDGDGTLTAYIWRWETDAECVAREASEKDKREAYEARSAAQYEMQERQTYEALKAKFG